MRMLHTSDWHIGRTFHGVDLLGDQEKILQALAEVVAAEDVEVVLVSGDVYDRSVPSADAIAVCQRGLAALRDAGAHIVVTSGNHDSATRLGAGGRFSEKGGLFLRTTVEDLDRPVLLADDNGPVAIYGIPYLQPEVVRDSLNVPEARSHEEVMTAAVARIRADAQRRRIGRTVVLAHAFVVGGVATGSERQISVGGVETVPVGVFLDARFDYVALGHLHSPQVIAESVRYAGSPLPYSFGENSHRKGVWIVDIGADALSVHARELPIVRGLSRLTGTMEELLTDAAHTAAEEDYVSATVTDHARPLDPMRRLRERFPYAVHMEWQGPQGDPALHYRDRVRGRSDTEIVDSFLTDVRSAPSSREMHWVQQALTDQGAS
ncbi:MAG: exonuclease SbcCD subunit D [Mycobacterium sp.]|nr:exonuclease SbcCD subunit D [Mycobacterium sp.]